MSFRCSLSTTRGVFQLCSTGHVQIRPPKLNDTGAVVEVFNTAIRLIIKAARESGHADDLKANLASFASGSGIYDALFLRWAR